MKRLWLYILLLPAILMMSSCNDDFELNAPYEDISIVFGLLDQLEDTTFVKINKAFLGEGNVLEMAKIEDSSIYKNDISAVIREYNGENLVNTFPLDTITINNKDDGIFYNPYQMVYFTPMAINDDHLYELFIQIGSKQVSSLTPVVKQFSIVKPSAGSNFIKILYDTEPNVEWISAVNGLRYEVVIRFNFKELMLGGPDTVSRYEDWALGVKKSKGTGGGEDMEIRYSGNGFYAWIQESVPYEDPDKEASVSKRFTENLEYTIRVAAQDLNIFMEVNEPSNSIVQEKPEVTNINNGLGLFSSRYFESRAKKIHPETIANIKNLEPDLKFVF